MRESRSDGGIRKAIRYVPSDERIVSTPWRLLRFAVAAGSVVEYEPRLVIMLIHSRVRSDRACEAERLIFRLRHCLTKRLELVQLLEL
jgi:hypothetical protein